MGPLIAAGLTALELPFALGGGRDLAENVGYDPTGRVRRGKNRALGQGLAAAGQTLGDEESMIVEQMLAQLLEGGGDPWAGMQSGGLSSEAEQITRPYREQLAAAQMGGRPSLTQLIAKAGLL